VREYWSILKRPQAIRLVSGVLPSRIAYSMLGLALFFHVHKQTGSLAFAGVCTGLVTLTGALTTGPRGNLVDRFGQTRPLLVFVPAYSIALIVVSVTESRDLLLTTCIFLGVMAPPINLSSRPLWRVIVAPTELRSAYALDAVTLNAAQVLGPTMATIVSLSLSPQTALRICAALITISGSLLITSELSRSWLPEPRQSGEPNIFRSRAMRVLALEGSLFGLGLGAFLVAIPASATLAGRPGLTAPILSGMSLASVLSGLMAGLITRKITPLNGFLWANVILALTILPFPLLSPGTAMIGAALLLGAAIGPAQVFHMEVIEAVRPRGTSVTAISWLWTVEGTMAAAGLALGGFLAERFGGSAALTLAATGMFLAAATIWIGKKSLGAADNLTFLSATGLEKSVGSVVPSPSAANADI
jgi:MFS family permease